MKEIGRIEGDNDVLGAFGYLKVVLDGGAIDLVLGNDHKILISDAAADEMARLLQQAIEQVKRERRPWKIDVVPHVSKIGVLRDKSDTVDYLTWKSIALEEGVPPLVYAINEIEKVIYIGSKGNELDQ